MACGDSHGEWLEAVVCDGRRRSPAAVVGGSVCPLWLVAVLRGVIQRVWRVGVADRLGLRGWLAGLAGGGFHWLYLAGLPGRGGTVLHSPLLFFL